MAQAPSAPLSVILAGAGARARAWAALLARATTARPVALVARDPGAAAIDLDVPRFATLDGGIL